MHPYETNQQSSSLIDLLLLFNQHITTHTLQEWELVSAHLRSHPHEASINHRSGRSPLEIALRCGGGEGSSLSPPVSVIRDLIRTNPRALCSGREGWTPLFTACSFKQPFDVIKFLLDAYPAAASMRTDQGRIPLHVNQNVKVACLLLDAFPGGVKVHDYRGKTPLHYAASKGFSVLIGALISGGKNLQSVAGSDFIKVINDMGAWNIIDDCGASVWDEDGRTPLDILCSKTVQRSGSGKEYSGCLPTHFWGSLTLLVRATISQTKRQNEAITAEDDPRACGDHPFQMLHAVVELGCPPAVVWHTLKRYPKQTSERDSCGRVPLSIAASMTTNEYADEVIKILVGDKQYGNPQAACKADGDGRLPLHLISEADAKFHEGVQCIFQAAPRAIETRDIKTGLFPFMLAAVGENGCIDSVFSLLREAPAVLSNFN